GGGQARAEAGQGGTAQDDGVGAGGDSGVDGVLQGAGEAVGVAGDVQAGGGDGEHAARLGGLRHGVDAFLEHGHPGGAGGDDAEGLAALGGLVDGGLEQADDGDGGEFAQGLQAGVAETGDDDGLDAAGVRG